MKVHHLQENQIMILKEEEGQNAKKYWKSY